MHSFFMYTLIFRFTFIIIINFAVVIHLLVLQLCTLYSLIIDLFSCAIFAAMYTCIQLCNVQFDFYLYAPFLQQ